MILHILNGDCALDGWKKCGFSGDVLVWRENYLQGTLPETDDLDLFNHIRAAELHKTAPEKSVDDIFSELQFMHKKLFSLRSADQLVLWLDCCPFDLALKKQLLKLISAMPEKPKLYLIQKDLIWNQETFEHFRNRQDYLSDFHSLY